MLPSILTEAAILSGRCASIIDYAAINVIEVASRAVERADQLVAMQAEVTQMLARWRDSFGHAGLALSLQRTRWGVFVGAACYTRTCCRAGCTLAATSCVYAPAPTCAVSLCREHWIQIDLGECYICMRRLDACACKGTPIDSRLSLLAE